jgi:hypothetical protein
MSVANRERSCGDCTACCRILAVESLGKPYGCDCRHQTATGCGIYRRRPDDCRRFSCLWLAGMGSHHDRPDRSGLLWQAISDKGLAYVEIYETRAGALATTDSEWFDTRLKEVMLSMPDVWRGRFGCVRLYTHGIPVGCAFAARPPYSDTTVGKGRLFQETSPGSGVWAYLGQTDGKGHLLSGDVEAAFNAVVAAASGVSAVAETEGAS